MSINDLISTAGRHPGLVAAVFLPLPVVAFLLGRLADGRGDRSPWKYAYATLVYAVCVPGIFAGVLTAYSLFFLRANLLQVNLLVYGLPIATMIAALSLIGRDVAFERIPGFDRLGGLILLIGVSFVVALFVTRARIWILFGSSIFTLFVMAVAAFVLLRWGLHRVMR